jgi:hypothetical protein
MSPAGAVPNVPAVAPPPSASARSLVLAGSRPMTSTALPPSIARVPYGAGVGPEAEDADAAHDVCLLLGVWGLGTNVDNEREDAATKPQTNAGGHAGDKGASLQRDYVGRSRVSPQRSNLGVFVEGHHVDNVHTLAGKDDLHVNDCFSAGHVQRH